MYIVYLQRDARAHTHTHTHIHTYVIIVNCYFLLQRAVVQHSVPM